MKCSTYPFCQCGAELMQGVREFARGPTWVQFELFGEEPLIYTEVASREEAGQLRAYLNREVDRIAGACPTTAHLLPEGANRGLSRPVHVAVDDEVNGTAHLVIGGAGRRGRKAGPSAASPGAS